MREVLPQNPTDDETPTFYRGFNDYKKFSKKWLDDMYRNTGWEVVQYILSDGFINPDFDYTLNYNVVPSPNMVTNNLVNMELDLVQTIQ